MRRVSSSWTLTVYHDGQFWVGLAEQSKGGRVQVARVVFGAEPSDEEVLDLVFRRWSQLRLTRPLEKEQSPLAVNPKRRQREAARELSKRGPSTKAQAALSEQRELEAKERKATARERRDEAERQKFELRRQKRKQKHRGR